MLGHTYLNTHLYYAYIIEHFREHIVTSVNNQSTNNLQMPFSTGCGNARICIDISWLVTIIKL